MIEIVLWNKSAVESLQSSYDFIFELSPIKADEFIDKVDSLISMLITFPDIGRRSEKFITVRQCRIDKYRKLYYRRENKTLFLLMIQDDRIDPNKGHY